ncbi:hypothetical protein MTsN2n6_38610 [Vibrio fortis]
MCLFYVVDFNGYFIGVMMFAKQGFRVCFCHIFALGFQLRIETAYFLLVWPWVTALDKGNIYEETYICSVGSH